MNKKLNKEAIDEIVHLLNEIKDVVRLLKEFGIYINSDSWLASTFGGEDILRWKRKNFEEIDEINWGDKFYIGGNVVTGNEHEYKNEYIIAPKELAEIEGKIFEKYLKSIIKSNPLKHFKLEFVDEFGLTENCGWEHYLRIDATIQKSALSNQITNNNIKEMRIKLPNGGVVTYINSYWYEIYQIKIDELEKEMDLLDKWGRPKGTINYINASEIVINHYIREKKVPTETILLVENGKLKI